MKKIVKISFISSLFISSLYANKVDILSSYNGNTGILDTPNARIMPDWSMRLFLNKDKPYTYYGLTITPLPFLETNFHITHLNGVDGFSDAPEYGGYKDKSLSFKILVKKESKYLPSLVFGVDDTWGTSLYTSKYLVMSKKISYFDLSLGYAKGRLGGENLEKYRKNVSNSGSFNNQAINFLKDSNWSGGKVFGSAVFNISPKYFFLLEYSPIKYEYDIVNPFDNGNNYKLPKSKINYGFKYKYSDNSSLSLSYQRGNTLSFGYSYAFGFNNEGILKHLPDKKWKASKKKKQEYNNLSEEILVEKLAKEVAAEKFKDVKASVNKNKIWLEMSNSRYYDDLKAAGRALSTVDEVANKKYDTFYLTLKDRGIKTKTLKVNRQEFDLYENEKVSDDYMKDALIISNNTKELLKDYKEDESPVFSKLINSKRYSYSLDPKIRSYLNKKEKPLALKFTLRAKGSFNINENLSINTALEHPFYNQGKDLPNEPLESEKLSIRSNFMEHFKYNSTQMSYLNLLYRDNFIANSLLKFEVGYLEYAYAGYDIEWYKSFFDEKLGLGLQYQNVYKRYADDFFDFRNNLNYEGKFLNLYYLIYPKYDIHLGAKIGEFLAGDKGIRLDFARHYKGFSLGAFATFTNSKKVFQNEKNKGHIDKGFYLTVPLETFTYKKMKQRVTFRLNAWTRDTGQSAGTFSSLSPMNNSENNSQIMKKYINKLKD